jgi:hypothetical protein
MRLREFVDRYGRPFSDILGIDLSSGRNGEIVKWFLASILYSKPIRESTATLTYQAFEQDGVVSPSKILETGWEGLVSLLDEGGYTRYDFSTAEKLLRVFGSLQKRYAGDLNRLHDRAFDSRDLERRLMGLGKGIGPTTVSIFLREMKVIWSKADPEPTSLVRMAMRKLGIEDIGKVAEQQRLDPVRLETALLRLGKDFIKKGNPVPVSIR